MVSVSAGYHLLAAYTYTAGNGKLTRMTYGNGEYEEYTYDNLDRLVKVTYNGSDENAFTVLYDSNGRLAKAVDGKAGITYLYEYDSLDRLIRAYQKDSSGNTIYAVENSYDEYGRAKSSNIIIGNKSMEYVLTYKTNTNLVGHVYMPETNTLSAINYTYDNFDRLTEKNISLSSLADFYEKYSYYTYTDTDGTVHTTPLVASLTLQKTYGGTVSSEVYEYTYNSLGYITTVKKNGTTIATYSYDSLGQLVGETVNNQIYIFSYDKSGNITQKHVYTGDIGNLTDTIIYTYSTSAWGDLLTNYDGTAITYDSIGNPTKWVDISSLTWNGRQLESVNIDGYDTVDYTYNADGIRTQKQIYDSLMGGYVTHNYTLDGTKIIKEYVTNTGTGASHTLYYVYDANGSITGLHYQNTPYYFQKNIQGDILRICNASGNVVVEYTYDAWGNILSVTGSMANTLGQYNPFRYRGYYYDSETDLYYLNSRYYDADVGRFISADKVSNLGANNDVFSYNLYAYCGNNPICRYDAVGELWWWVIPIVGVILILPGCSKNNNNYSNSNYGVASKYRNIQGGMSTPNCYAYAIELDYALNPGTLSKKTPSFNKVKEVAKAVIADLKTLGRSARIIDGPNDSIKSNEYRIAVRCGTRKYVFNQWTGVYSYSNKFGSYDYHFMVQTSDGRWAEKHGTGGNSILHAFGKNPNNLSWDLGNLIGYYDSKIIYLAVTR